MFGERSEGRLNAPAARRSAIAAQLCNERQNPSPKLHYYPDPLISSLNYSEGSVPEQAVPDQSFRIHAFILCHATRIPSDTQPSPSRKPPDLCSLAAKKPQEDLTVDSSVNNAPTAGGTLPLDQASFHPNRPGSASGTRHPPRLCRKPHANQCNVPRVLPSCRVLPCNLFQ